MKTDSEKLKIIYQLLNETVLIIASMALLLLFAENLLPGFISKYLSFLRLTILLLALISATSFLGRKLNLKFNLKLSRSFATLAFFYLIVILSLSNFKFSMKDNIVITLTSAIIIFYLYKQFTTSE